MARAPRGLEKIRSLAAGEHSLQIRQLCWLGEKCIEARLEATLFDFVVGMPGERHNFTGYVHVFSHDLEQLEAVDARHRNVNKNDLWPQQFDRVQGNIRVAASRCRAAQAVE